MCVCTWVNIYSCIKNFLESHPGEASGVHPTGSICHTVGQIHSFIVSENLVSRNYWENSSPFENCWELIHTKSIPNG